MKLQIVVPMAGEGSRFAQAGYTTPKPFIMVRDKPMIAWVIDNVNLPGFEVTYIFIIRREHDEKHDFKGQLQKLAANVKIVYADKLTEGAACTVLLAEKALDMAAPMLVVNSDQFVEWDVDGYAAHLKECIDKNYHSILCFTIPMSENDTKWSYAKLDGNGFITDVKEKEVISEHATVGIYFWVKAGDYVSAAKTMIEANDRVKNEFYVCPVYDYNHKAGEKSVIFSCRKMWGLGVPADLEYFLKKYKS